MFCVLNPIESSYLLFKRTQCILSESTDCFLIGTGILFLKVKEFFKLYLLYPILSILKSNALFVSKRSSKNHVIFFLC